MPHHGSARRLQRRRVAQRKGRTWPLRKEKPSSSFVPDDCAGAAAAWAGAGAGASAFLISTAPNPRSTPEEGFTAIFSSFLGIKMSSSSSSCGAAALAAGASPLQKNRCAIRYEARVFSRTVWWVRRFYEEHLDVLHSHKTHLFISGSKKSPIVSQTPKTCCFAGFQKKKRIREPQNAIWPRSRPPPTREVRGPSRINGYLGFLGRGRRLRV